MTMALKPSQITRRNFVQRAGLLVASLGVAGGVQSGLMDNIIRKATKKWGGEALAAGSTGVNYCVELLFRAGAQIDSLFPSPGHFNTPVGSREPRLNVYSSPANIIKYTSPNAQAMPVYIAKYTAGVGGDQLATTIGTLNSATERIGISTSSSVNLQTGQHTSNFSSRAPNGSAPCPAVLHASLAAPAPVNGIEWNNGVSTTNQRGSLGALARVSDQTTFNGLFKNVPMFFSLDELKLIAGEIENGSVKSGGLGQGAIGDLDDLYLSAKTVPGAADMKQVSVAGRGQAQLSLLAAIQSTFTTQSANFTNINQNLAGAQLGVAMCSALAAFANGASTTMTISMDFGDWHGDINSLDDATGKQGQFNTYVGNAISGFLKSAAALPNFFDPSKKIADSLLISLSSEFTRTPLRNGSGAGGDNGDGGTAAFAFIGSSVKSGALGDITGTNGNLVGFNPTTGAVGGASTISEAMVWKTTNKLLGIADSATSMVAANPISYIVK
jgi:hypothetical protein